MPGHYVYYCVAYLTQAYYSAHTKRALITPCRRVYIPVASYARVLEVCNTMQLVKCN